MYIISFNTIDNPGIMTYMYNRPSEPWRITPQQAPGEHWQTYWRMNTASTESEWRQLIA